MKRRSDRQKRHLRPAFTMVEMLIVIAVLGSIIAMALPNVNNTIRQRRVIAAASALSGDVDAAFSLAARQRRPVRVAYHAASGEIRVADRVTGTVYRRRPLRLSSEYHLDAVSMSPSSIDVYPNGVGSAGFSVNLTNGAFQRQILVTRTGLTRVLIP
jgi:prepilin-type N-terminal cleavage/methylation domain-containing protein